MSFDEMLAKSMQIKLFPEAQGYEVTENVVFRDNQSSMTLEKHGKASSQDIIRYQVLPYH